MGEQSKHCRLSSVPDYRLMTVNQRWCGSQACTFQNPTWQLLFKPPAGKTGGPWITPPCTPRWPNTGLQKTSLKGLHKVGDFMIIWGKKKRLIEAGGGKEKLLGLLSGINLIIPLQTMHAVMSFNSPRGYELGMGQVQVPALLLSCCKLNASFFLQLFHTHVQVFLQLTLLFSPYAFS